MELPTSFQRQEFPSAKQRFERFCCRMVSRVAGDSVITTGKVRPFLKVPAPRLGLRLSSGDRTGSDQPRRNIPCGTRSRSSTCSLIEPNISSDRTVGSFAANMPPLQIEWAEVRRTQPNQSRRLNCFLSGSQTRSATTGAWVRRARTEREKSKGHRYCCGPDMKTKAAKKKILRCVVSGTLLLILLAIYLGLAFANVTTDREFHVLLILFIMLLTILFCHSFVRLFMIALKPPHGHIPRRRIPSRMDGSGYAQPDEPIPVFLARDEEITGGSDMDNAAKRGIIATPPPAYGVWKSTVRLNPNLVYWQLADRGIQGKESKVKSDDDGNERRKTTYRPPSYVSEDGVRYVVDMQSRPQPQSQTHSPSILLVQ